MTRGSRLRLGGVAAPDKRAAFVALAERALSLSREEARALLDRFPIVLALGSLSEGEDERLQRAFASLGVDAQLSPATIQVGTCTRHRKLALSELCAECGEERVCVACLRLRKNGACVRCATRSSRRTTFRRVRIGVLLSVLIAVALTTLLDQRRIASWKAPVVVAIFPIAETTGAEGHVRALDASAFASVATFFQAEAKKYNLTLATPVDVRLGPVIAEKPPAPPALEKQSAISIALWSIQLRYWAYKMTRGTDANVRVFAVYVPNQGQVLEHSLGLEKGRIGVANLFATKSAENENAVVIAHEVLHTLGATDKYDASGRPSFPEGYGDPQRQPRFPQERAEIMAGSIAVSETQAHRVESLESCNVGPETATEIGWRKSQEQFE